ncbi:MAG: flagellar basal body-associated FliL family protein [Gemmobacter sp.]
MAEAAAPQDLAPKRASKKPLLLALVVAVAGGGGAFYATWSGLIGGSSATEAKDGGYGGGEAISSLPAVAFVPVTPVVISLGESSTSRHLRMTAQLEVAPAYSAEVTYLMPRILDILNGYLRAIEVAELDDPAALVRIRAQLLRRIQIVTGEGRVRDLLITEFVLN